VGVSKWIRVLGDNLPDSFIYQYVQEVDGTKGFLYVSAGIFRLTGVTAHEAVHDTGAMLRLVDPEQIPALLAAEAVSARDLTDFAMDLRMRRLDGAWRWMQVRSSPSRQPDGSILWAGVQTDITERTEYCREITRLNRLHSALSQINRALVQTRSREELFQKVTRALVEFGKFKMVWIGELDPASQEIKVVAHLGDDCGYLKGVRIFADDRPEGLGPSGTAVREGRPYICNDFLHDPRTLPWRETAVTPGWRSSAAFPISQAGRICGALTIYDLEPNFFGEREVALLEETARSLSFGLDHLEQQRLHLESVAALRDTEAQLRLSVAASNVGLWEWDLVGNEVFFSPEWKGLIGYSDDEIPHRLEQWQSRIHPDDLAPTLATLRGYLETAVEKVSLEYRLRHKDGSYRWIVAQAQIFRDAAGKPLRLLGCHIDITGRKQAEEKVHKLNEELEERVRERTAELETVNRELETFSYSVSHDLKAPLRGIDGYSQLLENEYHDRLDDEGRLFIRNVRASAAQMHQLIEDLLSYSRMERRSLLGTEVDLPALVRCVVDERSAEMEKAGTRLSLEVPCLTVRADRDGLAMVLRNLLENALKFSGDVPSPALEIGARSEEGRAVLWVRDNGIGFDMKFHDRIFEIFQRLQRSESYPGTGIGLALVRKAMQRMGGRAWAESVPGEGATFFLEIPL